MERTSMSTVCVKKNTNINYLLGVEKIFKEKLSIENILNTMIIFEELVYNKNISHLNLKQRWENKGGDENCNNDEFLKKIGIK